MNPPGCRHAAPTTTALALVAACVTMTLSVAGCAPRHRPSFRTSETNPLFAPDAHAPLAPAPDSFAVAFETTKGLVVVSVVRNWAPRGADRFHYLVRNGFYDGARFSRVVPAFVVQFGLKGDPGVDTVWRKMPIADDAVTKSNARATVTFASNGPNTRTTQLFVNLRDNAYLDSRGFAPLGRVTAGMEVVDSLYSGYGEGAPEGRGPSQARIQQEGNSYLEREFPRLDAIRAARVIWESGGGAALRRRSTEQYLPGLMRRWHRRWVELWL